ncbi:surface carbohydrate biosynthesis protein [Erythrobacter sp. KY5]|uniref:surface carbohydrate biosynthesis protein n=1 Tax=Erythrobacter sp. KY5 TaxID=2011159 RepID=UPI0013A6FC96|nr:surface carbohydrate biosynthesis protein [Erythrobacter sp. KY5]
MVLTDMAALRLDAPKRNVAVAGETRPGSVRNSADIAAADKRRPHRIGLVIDHPLRDLDGMCLLAQLLCGRGHEVVLMPFYTQHLDLPNLDIDLIVLNYVRPANRALVEAASARGIALAVLDTEGGLLPETGPTSAHGIAAYLRESGLDIALSLYLFWGEALRDAVVENTDLSLPRAVVTGSPRFDLAASRYRRADERRDRVLVNTNFPIVNPAQTGRRSIDDKALRSAGFTDQEIADLAESVRGVMDRMVATVGRLADARPSRSFVIRPHPFERCEPYEAAFAAHPNIVVEREGSAMNALLQSDCMLHVNCTTAVEASLCGVPSISLDFINDARLQAMASLPTKVSHNANDVAHTLALIDRSHTLDAASQAKDISPFFGPLDARAAERAADALSSATLIDPRLPSAKGLPAKRWLNALAGRTVGSAGIEQVRQSLKPSRAIKSFSAADVEPRLDHFASVHGSVAAAIEPVRTALGADTMALRLSPVTARPAD